MAKSIQGQGNYWTEFGKLIVDKSGENALRVETSIVGSSSIVIVSNYGQFELVKQNSDWNVNSSASGVILDTEMYVGIVATKLPPTTLQKRRSIDIYVNAGSNIYIGSSAVTIASGMPIQGYKSYQIDTSADVYGITGSQSVNLRILEAS